MSPHVLFRVCSFSTVRDFRVCFLGLWTLEAIVERSAASDAVKSSFGYEERPRAIQCDSGRNTGEQEGRIPYTRGPRARGV